MTDGSSREFRQRVEQFLATHQVDDYSAARFVYSLNPNEDKLQKLASRIADAMRPVPEKDRKNLEKIKNISDFKEIAALLSEGIGINSTLLLRDKMLEYEDELENIIKNRCFNNRNTEFTENALYYFEYCTKNHSQWIADHLTKFKDPYERSMLALVIGFRGEPGHIGLLMKETNHFKKRYPKEEYDQGPLLAVWKLYERYFEEENDDKLPA